VGRKTANVVLNVAFGEPTMAADTHIFRLGNRTGLAPGRTPLEVERKLVEKIPAEFLVRRAPLVDIARALRVPGTQTAVRGVRRGGRVWLPAKGGRLEVAPTASPNGPWLAWGLFQAPRPGAGRLQPNGQASPVRTAWNKSGPPGPSGKSRAWPPAGRTLQLHPAIEACNVRPWVGTFSSKTTNA
jgi:hypothetical protein